MTQSKRHGQRPDYGDAALTIWSGLRQARSAATAAGQLASCRSAARELHDALMNAPCVRFYRSFDLVRVPYPTRFGLREACTSPLPLLHILNRLFVIQVETRAGLRTLLVSPSDADANAETPFFRRMQDRMGRLRPQLTSLLAPRVRTVEEALALTGIPPERVDYITYDHLHTQDIRRWFGTGERDGTFPNARLLVMREEWAAAGDLTPPQRDWYCPNGIAGVHPSRVLELEHDVMIGESVALFQTPGHTRGNHSIAARTPEGVLVTSENGISPDCYAPEHSELPGLRAYARDTGMEVVLNGNTLEAGLDQYISMVVEKTVAGPSTRNPALPNLVLSSELTPYWLFPGLTPTLRFGELSFGAPS